MAKQKSGCDHEWQYAKEESIPATSPKWKDDPRVKAWVHDFVKEDPSNFTVELVPCKLCGVWNVTVGDKAMTSRMNSMMGFGGRRKR